MNPLLEMSPLPYFISVMMAMPALQMPGMEKNAFILPQTAMMTIPAQ